MEIPETLTTCLNLDRLREGGFDALDKLAKQLEEAGFAVTAATDLDYAFNGNYCNVSRVAVMLRSQRIIFHMDDDVVCRDDTCDCGEDRYDFRCFLHPQLESPYRNGERMALTNEDLWAADSGCQEFAWAECLALLRSL